MFKGKFVLDLRTPLIDWVLFNDSYRDYSDVTFVRGATEYDFDDVLVVAAT